MHSCCLQISACNTQTSCSQADACNMQTCCLQICRLQSQSCNFAVYSSVYSGNCLGNFTVSHSIASFLTVQLCLEQQCVTTWCAIVLEMTVSVCRLMTLLRLRPWSWRRATASRLHRPGWNRCFIFMHAFKCKTCNCCYETSKWPITREHDLHCHHAVPSGCCPGFARLLLCTEAPVVTPEGIYSSCLLSCFCLGSEPLTVLASPLQVSGEACTGSERLHFLLLQVCCFVIASIFLA